ncbi:nucleic acid dioxygenase ALKBH1 isoform X2 [Podarcis muralis]
MVTAAPSGFLHVPPPPLLSSTPRTDFASVFAAEQECRIDGWRWEGSSCGRTEVIGGGGLGQPPTTCALRCGIPQIVSSPLSFSSVSDHDAYRAGLRPVNQWKAYGLKNYPGFIFIPDPFLPGCQRHWVKQCLKTYTQKPNVCNLDMHMSSTETTDLWGKSQHQLRFGQSSIFLLGGLKRDEAPVAMFMHSGDMMIMSGFSRLLYHAVPRILPNLEGKPLPSCLELPLPADLPEDSVMEPCSQEDWQVCAKYLQASRVNMTVRQVLAEGQSFPIEARTGRDLDASSVGSCHEEHSEIKKHKSDSGS